MSPRLCWIRSGARGSSIQAARRRATLSRSSTSRSASRPQSDERELRSKRAMIGLPATGDGPGSGSIASVAAGVVSRNGRVHGSLPNRQADPSVAPCPPTVMNFWVSRLRFLSALHA